MKRPPSDREILREIHSQYLSLFGSFERGNPDNERQSKIYVPIDCAAIAEKLGVDPDIVFGRLYYHLDKKYGYTQEDGSKVHLFAFFVGGDRHAVHFPMLSAVLAELEQSWFRFTAPLVISSLAFIVSVIGLACGGS
ncbi:hypothetical protein [Halomonas elongata]|uniref:hypothetical protein n=1 Tax=Halomonas elongata TaxID=2746 RepID=UPI00403416A8